MVEWTTPRKAPALRAALDHRTDGGSIKKLCFERHDDPNFPSQPTLSRWMNQYDRLAQHNDPVSALEQASRRTGAVTRPRTPERALAANQKDQYARGPREDREQDNQRLAEGLEASVHTLKKNLH